jgi:hypothetical protein
MAWFSDEGKQPPMTDYIIHVNPILTVKGKKTDYIIQSNLYIKVTHGNLKMWPL